ncbi:hypothetical protein CspeluHIS016_0801430 [Cutaneotrichosporon spelunceum]|uniref:UBC core domain-containing protein n=1 Tax=Cutaneotrichosporon spelunceum TaxID=1672016 RepID=A0AAD3TZ51_9TREE|nr:hypothetical protein CspeluHIS016_0801430 [Cutaneotrichosporon spelunceum]
MPPRVNLRSSAVKRIMQEAAEAADTDTDGFIAAPLEAQYEGGLYHLRILLPASYPMSAPDIVLLTPNGRFELGKKICIDGLTSFHAGSWQPAWGVRTAITGLRAFWTQEGEALSAIGALDVPKEERRRLAKLSRDWTCPTCGESNATLLPDSPEGSNATPEGNSNQEEEEQLLRTASPAPDMRLSADDTANADISPTIPTGLVVPGATDFEEEIRPFFPTRQDTDPFQAILGSDVEPMTQPPAIPQSAPVIDETTAQAAAVAGSTSNIPSNSSDALSLDSDGLPAPSHPMRLGSVPLVPTPTTASSGVYRRGGPPPPPAPGARPSPGPAVTGRSASPAAHTAAPVPGARPAPLGHSGVPARFTVPPLEVARRPPLWLDALIGALVIFLLYLLTGRT